MAPKVPKYPRKSTPRRNRLDLCAIIRAPRTTELAVKETEDSDTPPFPVDGRTDKRQITRAGKELCDADVAEVNPLIRPDREEQAWRPLAPDRDALAVANKIGTV